MSQQHEPDPETLFCPKCGSTDVRRSRGEGLRAFLFAIFGRMPFRCRSCRSKFYRQADAPEEEEHSD
jgi:transposase-like protein